MTAKILQGREIAAKIQADIAQAIFLRQQNQLPIPGLAVILVGNDTASQTYVNNKQRACKEVGIFSKFHPLPEHTDAATLSRLIDTLNQDPHIHGILLQLPLPKSLSPNTFLEQIDPKKDVDGFHPYNIGRLVQQRPLLRPCTPYGVMTLLHETGEDLVGKQAVVVGASNIVGRPMALELLFAKCTVTICHSATTNLSQHIQQADILISATGKSGIIQSEWIKPAAIVIDVGFHRTPSGKIRGDIDFETAKQRASWITPVPGGVGPLTIATLLQNTLLAATRMTQ